MNLFEGTLLKQGWSDAINSYGCKLIVPSKATKNLFVSNGVIVPIEVVNYGVDTKTFTPEGTKAQFKIQHERFNDDTCVFLSINSWGLIQEPGGRWALPHNDRKGFDLLIKAYCEEFKKENVMLFLKISTFWRYIPEQVVADVINDLSKDNSDVIIIFDNKQIPKQALANLYRSASCFVTPTRGESWGMTIAEAMASGLPLIVTKDHNSGYMDFCKGADGVFWIDNDGYVDADPQFFPKGNMQANPSIESLRKQLRKVYDMWVSERAKLKELGLKNRKAVENMTWENAAKKFIEAIQ
jgi:glycosyltransferase involved in cell wall biosynthesis